MSSTKNNKGPLAHVSKDGRPHLLQNHLKEVGRMAGEFAEKIGLPSLGELMGLLHDLGKYSVAFQSYLLSATGYLNPDADEYVDADKMKGKIDHSSAGAQYIWESLKNKDHLYQLAAQMMSLCIASHHSGLIDCVSSEGTDSFSKRMSKPKNRTHLDEVKKKIDEPIQKRVDKLLVSDSIEHELIQRLPLLFNGGESLEIREFMLGFLVRFLFSTLIDADRLNSADFANIFEACERYNGAYPGWQALIEKLDAHITGFKIRNQVDIIRNEVSSTCLNFSRRGKGLFHLTVPTGGGKTLASLRFALHHAKHHEMDRIVYVVPYTSIIDQNAETVRSILEGVDEESRKQSKQIVLEHHSNLTPEKDTWQGKLLSENWDAPITFTTAVQFLESLFAGGTRGARRMHQLANSVIIFDEIQTLPIKTIHLFNNAVNFFVKQCGSTVVFCTATQPLLDQVDASKGMAKLSENPHIMPDTEKLFKNLRRVEIIDARKNGGWTGNDVADCVREELKQVFSVLIIVNTKAQARELYNLCRKITACPQRASLWVFHLSTSMCPAHRMRVLNIIRKCLNSENPKPIICVSTQLIEAGVDVDFGTVIRYLAGLDSIAQAAGRCNRNGLRASGRVFIVNPEKESLSKLPDIRRAKEKTERILGEFQNNPTAFDHDLLSPTTMSLYYRYYFFDRAHEMTYPVKPHEMGRDDSLFSLLSTNSLSVNAYQRANNTAPPIHLRQSFKSAAEAFRVIDTPTEGVIVPYGKEGKQIISDLSAASQFENRYHLIKQAQRYSVNMYPYEIEILKKAQKIYETLKGSGIFYLDSQYYSGQFGASVEPVGPMETLMA